MNLLTIASRTGVHHEVDRIQFLATFVMLKGAEHDVGNLVARVCPDVDDLVVALAIRDDAFAILLLDLFDLPVGVLQLGRFFFRNNHVRNSDGDTGLGRVGESEFLQQIECLDRFLRTSHLVATPDDVAELFLARGFVEEAETLGPDLVEDDAPRGRLDDLRLGVAVNGLAAEVRITQPNPVVRFNRAVVDGELHFNGVAEKRKIL